MTQADIDAMEGDCLVMIKVLGQHQGWIRSPCQETHSHYICQLSKTSLKREKEKYKCQNGKGPNETGEQFHHLAFFTFRLVPSSDKTTTSVPSSMKLPLVKAS